METKNIKIGDQVEFMLDGNPFHKGSGEVVYIGEYDYQIKLNGKVKGHFAGDKILVGLEEIEKVINVVFNKIEPETCEIRFNGKFFARANEYEFHDIRLQIVLNKVDGFTAINKDGLISVLETDGSILGNHHIFSFINHKTIEIALAS